MRSSATTRASCALLAVASVLGSLGAASGAAVAAPPAWSGALGGSTTSQAQWGPFISRFINYQYNASLTTSNYGFNILGARARSCAGGRAAARPGAGRGAGGGRGHS